MCFCSQLKVCTKRLVRKLSANSGSAVCFDTTIAPHEFLDPTGRIPSSFSAQWPPDTPGSYPRLRRVALVLLRSKHFVEEAFGSFGVAFCRDQKADGLAG
jgi:hypothetical protein